ncbi:unnamed protein product [Anisakis simplex]|uniref:glucuronosyltransferase n=1 Tax=Anisakis simplex TaxID=6269 RepID=A0A0M3K945_ANISI|nr:unnamed protein product [Anisakis simplex]
MKGVPVLVIPLIRDQFYNARVIEYRGLGLYIRKTDLHNYGTIRSTLHKLLGTKRFSQNAKRFSAMLNNRAKRSRDLLLHWTDLIAEFGSLPELKPYGGNYRTVKYFTIDVIITCLLSVIASLIFKFSLVFVLYRLTKKLQLTAVDLLSSQKRKKTV